MIGAPRYFGPRFFAARYWAKGASGVSFGLAGVTALVSLVPERRLTVVED